MKRLKSKLLAMAGSLSLLILCVHLSSCSDDDVWIFDFAPVSVRFEVVNADGDNLTAPGAELYGAEFSVLYQGTQYDADWSGREDSRYLMPTFYGLRYFAQRYDGSGLYFGDLDGQGCEATIVLQLPDGTSHDIYIRRIVKTKGKDYKITQTVTLDGRRLDQYSDGSNLIAIPITLP